MQLAGRAQHCATDFVGGWVSLTLKRVAKSSAMPFARASSLRSLYGLLRCKLINSHHTCDWHYSNGVPPPRYRTSAITRSANPPRPLKF